MRRSASADDAAGTPTRRFLRLLNGVEGGVVAMHEPVNHLVVVVDVARSRSGRRLAYRHWAAVVRHVDYDDAERIETGTLQRRPARNVAELLDRPLSPVRLPMGRDDR